MIKLLPVILTLAVAPAAFGTTFTVTDPFNSTCPTPGSASCDVIGLNTSFDIQRGEFSFGPTSSTMTLYFNYGPNNTSLAPFTLASVVLSLGDLFISGPGYNYGIALQAHNTAVSGSVAAGTLYQINNSNGVLTAAQALGNPGFTYRPGEIVWLNNSVAGALTPIVTGLVSIVGGGNGTTNAEFVATITLGYAAGSAVSNNLNGLVSPTIHFASATCGNDVMNGTVPEPATLGMIGGALLLAASLKFRKNRK